MCSLLINAARCLCFSNSQEAAASAAEYQAKRERLRRVSVIAREQGDRRLTLNANRPDDLIEETQASLQLSDGIGAMPGRNDNHNRNIDGQDVSTILETPGMNSPGQDYYSLISNRSPEELLKRRNKSKRVTLNVGGQRHEVLWSTLERIPNTRLGRLRDCVTHDAIMSLCDDYDIVQNEYFFDRHPTAFSTVIDFYRTGKLHLLDDICIMSYSDELEFWGIEEYYMEQCCLNKFNQRRDHMLEEMRKDKECLHMEAAEVWGPGKLNKAKKFIWDLLEKPDSSKPAKVQTSDHVHINIIMNKYLQVFLMVQTYMISLNSMFGIFLLSSYEF